MEMVRLHGADIESCWEELARLRIQVFRSYPYLYEGTLEYEHDYLRTYWQSPDSLVVLLRDQGQAVGATTALPLSHEQPEFQKPFENPDEYFYLGESVLLPAYRGRGLGHLFFDEREARARSLGRFVSTCFCAVQRPAWQAPADYRSLEGFWTKRGYQHQPHLQCRFSWCDLGHQDETEKTLSFWIRPLESAFSDREP